MEKRIEIYDSTLRNSTLSQEVVYTIEDKLKIVSTLDSLGISFIEVADIDHWPSEADYFRRLRALKLENTQLVVRGSTRAKDRSASEDPRCKALMTAETGVVSILGESCDFIVRDEKRVSLEENLRMIGDTITYFKRGGKMVIFVADHFFDGYKNNHSYARETIRAAQDAGADRVVLSEAGCGCFTSEVFSIVETMVRERGGRLGIESHNDTGCAIANSIAGVRAGAMQVHGTFLGVGEGCGNAQLCTLIPNLQLRMGISCVKSDMVQEITRTAVYLAELCNHNIPAGTPYVGRDAFEGRYEFPVNTFKTAEVSSYSAVSPEMVGNSKVLTVSRLGSKTTLVEKLGHFTPFITREQLQSKEIRELFHQKEMEGYHYDSAEASLILLILKHCGHFEAPYEILSLRILDEQPRPRDCENVVAYLKLRVGRDAVVCAEEREGLMAAIWAVMVTALRPHFPDVANLRVTNYRIRLTESERKSPRVSIDVTDGKTSWSTVGISVDIVSAIFDAVKDAFDYALAKGTLH